MQNRIHITALFHWLKSKQCQFTLEVDEVICPRTLRLLSPLCKPQLNFTIINNKHFIFLDLNKVLVDLLLATSYFIYIYIYIFFFRNKYFLCISDGLILMLIAKLLTQKIRPCIRCLKVPIGNNNSFYCYIAIQKQLHCRLFSSHLNFKYQSYSVNIKTADSGSYQIYLILPKQFNFLIF